MIRRPHEDRDLSRAELELAAADLLRRRDEWGHLVHHDPGGARTYEQLLLDDHVEVWLICWSDGNDTGFHDHDRSLGAVAVANGRVREETLAIGGDPVVREVAGGGVFSFEATDIHRVLHVGDEAAVTLHLYSPPLRRMGAYEVLSDGRLARRSVSAEEELAPASAPGEVPAPVG
jgi:predicted metal-dependent enzyme (double-stranded beta helix superfamily)